MQELKLKGKKEKELLVVVIAASWKGVIEREIDEFFRSTVVSSISQIHVIYSTLWIIVITLPSSKLIDRRNEWKRAIC